MTIGRQRWGAREVEIILLRESKRILALNSVKGAAVKKSEWLRETDVTTRPVSAISLVRRSAHNTKATETAVQNPLYSRPALETDANRSVWAIKAAIL